MPLDYIIFILMKLLKERKKKTIISKEVLSKTVSEFFAEAQLDEEIKESLLEDFDFKYELEVVLDNYSEYIFEENNYIVLSDMDMDDLDNLIDDTSMNYGESQIEVINNFFEFNIPVLELLGIKMEGKLYENGIDLEKSIVEGYLQLARIEVDKDKISEKTLYELKRNIIKRKFLFNQMKLGLTIEEYEDLYKYCSYKADLLGIDTLELKLENDELAEEMEIDPFYRALFFIDSNKELIFAESFDIDSSYKDNKAREVFYLKVIDIINNRINKDEYDDTDDDLVYAKYRLMYAMDMLFQNNEEYDGYLFMGDRKTPTCDNDYSFAEDTIFFFIDEMFEYTDKEIANSMGADYDNTIKAILIEAYYELTKDERVIETIKNNPNYGKYHFITGLFDNIINKNKTKIKRKEE